MVAVTHTVVANRGMMLFRLPEAGGLIGDGVSRPDTQEMDQRREHAQLLATTFAASALKERKMGNPTRYQELIRRLSDRQELTLDKRLNWIAALSNQVSALTSDCAALVEVVLSWQWSAWEDLTLAQAYAQFLEHLVSAHAFYVVPTMRSLVACFHYRRASSFAHLVNESDGMTLKEKAAEITRQVYNHVHQTLYRILELIPTSALKLAKVLSESFPYQRESARVQTTYLKNMLRVLNYAPILRDAVMRAIVERILQVDVEIQVELDELNEEEEMESAWQDDLMEQDGVFAMETGMEMDATGSAPVGMTASDSGNEEDDEEDMREEDEYLSDEDYPSEEEDPEAFGEEPAGLTIAEIRKLTDKLDSMMQLVFQHLAARRERDPQAAVADFYLLLETFDHSILRTFKSRYTQFLLFYQASVSPDLTDIFLGHLIEKLCDTTQPTVIRLAAASYVSSFVARAAYISKESVRSAMAVLVGWAHLYVDQNEVNCAWPDSERYSVFYAIVQAILYIFCFRWRDLRLDMDDEHDANLSNRLHLTVPTVDTEAPSSVEGGAKVNTQEEWCLGLAGLQRIITSRFNPLKVCSPNVVKQFARLANRLNFLYVYTIIERNKRLYLPQRRSALHGGVDTHFMTHSTTQDSSVQHNGDQNTDVAASITQALDSFFPFDPYRLAQSSVYITPLYKEWEEEDDDIEEQEGDDFDEESGYQDEDNDNDVGDDEDSPTTPTSTKAGVDIPPAIDLPHQPASGIMSARLRAELNQGNAQSFSDSVLAMSISPQTHILDAQRQALLFNND